MATFIGEYNCKIDEKGRLLLPMAFKKQMSSAANDTFVVKKDIYEKCLSLYSFDEWERQVSIIRQNLNPYNREHNAFLRGFYKGTAEVTLDNSNRILIPKRLLQEADIDKEIVKKYSIKDYPCFIFLDDKENEIHREYGEIEKEKLIEIINTYKDK